MSHFDASGGAGGRRGSVCVIMRFDGFRRPLCAVCAGAALLVAACDGDQSTANCVTNVTTDCAPLYPSTFDQVYARTLAPTCAQPGGVCHGSSGVQGGLFFSTPDTAYSLLLGEVDGRPRVVPGNAACSLLVERIASTNPSQVMPPGAPLSAAETCSIVQWINAGAHR
jgi:hypothetical protein